MQLQKLKDAIATHNKAGHSISPSDSNVGVGDTLGVSLLFDDKQS